MKISRWKTQCHLEFNMCDKQWRSSAEYMQVFIIYIFIFQFWVNLLLQCSVFIGWRRLFNFHRQNIKYYTKNACLICLWSSIYCKVCTSTVAHVDFIIIINLWSQAADANWQCANTTETFLAELNMTETCHCLKHNHFKWKWGA